MVIVPLKVVVHIDSMHGDPSNNLFNGICAFMDAYSNTEIRWEEWILYIPKKDDVPYQSTNNILQLNCGVHMLTWIYLLYTGTYYY